MKSRKDRPIANTTSERKIRDDMKVSDINRKARSGITKKEFFTILDKASQSIKHEDKSNNG